MVVSPVDARAAIEAELRIEESTAESQEIVRLQGVSTGTAPR